jgi:magnesium transporter
MARFIKARKETIGMAPDDLRLKGERRAEHVRLRCIAYNVDELKEAELKAIPEAEKYNSSSYSRWINIDGLHDPEVLGSVASFLEAPKMVLSDVVEPNGRPAFKEFDDFLFLSGKILRYDENTQVIHAEQISFLFNAHTLFSFQERVGDVFEPVRERLRAGKKKMREGGPSYLAYALYDVLIDNYLYILSILGEQIETLDQELTDNPTNKSLAKINKLKQELGYASRLIKPCREAVYAFVRSDSEVIPDGYDGYFQELRNNMDLANETADHYRTMLSEQLNVFHSTVSYNLNEILKTLTIFSVVFIPLSFIVGVYGTNFQYVPELTYEYGYFVMWGVIVTLVSGMLIYFKRKGWY